MSLVNNPDEILYRKIHILPHFWDDEFNRPSSAAFKDKKGLSVDKLGTRQEDEVIKSFSHRFPNNIRCIVKISVQKCLDIDVYPIDKPTANNIFHAEIHDSCDCITIGQEKALKLAKTVEVITDGE